MRVLLYPTLLQLELLIDLSLSLGPSSPRQLVVAAREK